MSDLQATSKDADPPQGTEIGTHHLLTFRGAPQPTEYVWSGTGWQSSPGGFGTKVHGMTALGWRYVSPCTVTTPALRATIMKEVNSHRSLAAAYLARAAKMEARIRGWPNASSTTIGIK